MHTPGPWMYKKTTLGSADNAKNRLIGSADNWVARLFSEDSTLPGLTSRAPTARAAEANAKLIAAAPDLLVELRNMIAEIRWHEQNAGLVLRGMGSANVEKAEAVLAKATA